MTDVDAFTSRLNPDMCVVTAATDAERSGCLVGFASQCSIRPVRFVVWLSKANHTYPVACAADCLAVHLLTRDQHELAALFGGRTGDSVDKFARVPWKPGHGGSAVLEDAAAWFVGTVDRRVDGGDHVGFVLAPVEWGGRAEGPLLRLDDVLDISPGHPA
ncbi:flavin reductase family protein [Streptomyces sp. NBC_00847]|uniref:flavin reductase family protein n=1 Tax=Streptomyces sp. NBC_00847 TaxID=2975850 RepID=UPI002250CF9D|nr:flavin reductase family protein [Streptomyces sp. NBC_00847]MCX4878455.1 flavin reductase family protein [Streptomyces sp. NBC_00847]